MEQPLPNPNPLPCPYRQAAILWLFGNPIVAYSAKARGELSPSRKVLTGVVPRCIIVDVRCHNAYHNGIVTCTVALLMTL